MKKRQTKSWRMNEKQIDLGFLILKMIQKTEIRDDLKICHKIFMWRKKRALVLNFKTSTVDNDENTTAAGEKSEKQ